MKTLFWLLLGLGTTVPAYAASSTEESSLPRERPERHVVLMPVVGVWSHSFRDSDYSAKLGAVYGFEVVLDPFRWLNVRGSVFQGNQPLHVRSDAFAVDAHVYQPTLDMMRMQLRAEPVWHYSERTSLYLGLGAGWARFTADAPKTTPRLISFQRSGVYLGCEGAVGASYEPIKDWMVIDISMGASYLSGQTGSIFESTQAFTEDGHRTTLGGLSKFSVGYRFGLGIGIVL
jgi:opacity protein-like surface antigen